MIAMLEGIVKGMAAAAHLFVDLLSISYKCGALIVAFISSVGSLIASTLTALASLVSILYKDFCFFSCDIFSKALEAGNLLTCLVSGAVSLLKNAILAVKDGFATVFGSAADGVSYIFELIGQIWDLLLNSAEFLKWILVVIGQGCWFAVQLVPLCIVYLIYSILSVVINILTEIADQTQMAGNFCIQKASSAGSWCFDFVTDFPVEALMGLVSIFIISYWLHKRRTSIKRAIIQASRWTGYTAKTAARRMWYTVVQFLQIGQSRQIPVQLHGLDDSDDEDVPLALRLRARKSLGKKGNLKRQLLIEQEEKLCVVCLEKNKCVILMPCRHLCMCMDCSAVITSTSSTCPICRTLFERAVVVYM